MEFIAVYYLADSTHAIKGVESIRARDMGTAFERTQNSFAVNMVIPRNKKNKAEIEKLLKMF